MTDQTLRVAFAGTPEFARVALRSLLDAGYFVPLVLTQPDRPAGRGMKLLPSPVKQEATEHQIPVSQPRSLRLDGRYPEDAAAARTALAEARPDMLVVAAYGLILPQWVLDLPRLGCLNIHASLLPRWRGAAPIQRAIEAGDEETGVTIMQMDAGLDTGAMLQRVTTPIGASDSAASLHDRLAAIGGDLIVKTVAQAARGALDPVPQPEEGVTYAQKIAKPEGHLDWNLPADVLERRLRAFDPFPGGSSVLDGTVIKIWRAHVLPALPGHAPGTVLAVTPDSVQVATGDGVLALSLLQRPGGRRQPVHEILQSIPIKAGMVFGGV